MVISSSTNFFLFIFSLAPPLLLLATVALEKQLFTHKKVKSKAKNDGEKKDF
jgi:hypothetical protein